MDCVWGGFLVHRRCVKDHIFDALGIRQLYLKSKQLWLPMEVKDWYDLRVARSLSNYSYTKSD